MSNEIETTATSTLPVPQRRGREYQRQCFERVEARIRAVPRDKLIQPTVAPVPAAMLILAAMPKFMTLRPRMERFGDEADLPLVDSIGDLAHAVIYTATDYVLLSGAGEPSQDLLDDATKLRSFLLDVKELCERQGLVHGELVTQSPRLSGATNLSRDLSGAVNFFERIGPELRKQLPVTDEQLDRAADIAVHLAEGGAVRSASPAERAAADLLRQQAFTCLMWAYEEVRDAADYLRRKFGDAEEYTPSVHAAGRSAPKRKEEAPETQPTPAPAPLPPTSAFANVPEVPVGHMGGNPFTS